MVFAPTNVLMTPKFTSLVLNSFLNRRPVHLIVSWTFLLRSPVETSKLMHLTTNSSSILHFLWVREWHYQLLEARNPWIINKFIFFDTLHPSYQSLWHFQLSLYYISNASPSLHLNHYVLSQYYNFSQPWVIHPWVSFSFLEFTF